MATILSLKRRIQAAQNVSKTTRAMQMIAASKLKRAQDATLSGRPYIEKLTSVSQNIRLKAQDEILHEYLQEKTETGKTLLLVFSPDKGLCGGLITNLIRKLFEYNLDNYLLLTVGKKVENYVIYLKKELIASFPFGNTLPTFDMVYPITAIINDYFLNKKVDKVEILSTSFESIFLQKPRTSTILPVKIPQEITTTSPFQLFEPAIGEILPDLLKRYLEMKIYQELLESYVSEQGARMIAMQNATNNAKDITVDLRLEYNKTRQAKITSEILDISGAGAQNAYE